MGDLGVGPAFAITVGMGVGGMCVGGVKVRRRVRMCGMEGHERRFGGRGWA